MRGVELREPPGSVEASSPGPTERSHPRLPRTLREYGRVATRYVPLHYTTRQQAETAVLCLQLCKSAFKGSGLIKKHFRDGI